MTESYWFITNADVRACQPAQVQLAPYRYDSELNSELANWATVTLILVLLAIPLLGLVVYRHAEKMNQADGREGIDYLVCPECGHRSPSVFKDGENKYYVHKNGSKVSWVCSVTGRNSRR